MQPQADDRFVARQSGYGRPNSGKFTPGTVASVTPTPSGRLYIKVVYDDGMKDEGNLDLFRDFVLVGAPKPNPLRAFTVAQVKRVYSGKPGCMCGCLGKYYEPGDRMIAKVLRILQADPRTVLEDGIAYTPRNLLADGERSYVVYLSGSL